MKKYFFCLLSCFITLLTPFNIKAETSLKKESTTNLAYIGSLSSFAANYGTAVLEGAQVAVKELNDKGENIQLNVEDDQSITKNTVNAYVKSANVNKVRGIIGGSWWINSIVKQSEKAKVPLISVETLYNKDLVPGENYFLLQGDLRDWINIYEPIIKKNNFKTGAIVRFVSGFGETLFETMKETFSKDGRTFLGDVEYNDVSMNDANSVALRLKKLNPDCVYIDSQPSGMANLLKAMDQLGMTDVTIFANNVIANVIKDNLYDLTKFKSIYYTDRVSFSEEFANKFKAFHNKLPTLNADLGYYAVYLLNEALKSEDPIETIKAGINVAGINFKFNENNVFSGAPQEVWKIDESGKKGIKVN